MWFWECRGYWCNGEVEEIATESEWSPKAFFRSRKYGWRRASFASFKVSNVMDGVPIATRDRLFAQSCSPILTLKQPFTGDILAITSAEIVLTFSTPDPLTLNTADTKYSQAPRKGKSTSSQTSLART